ncbi:MAG: SHOCT domain-containing protein [Verrucomicrobiales bacterium]|nr:SHOCT domain-containing protein [Verrucomicrobiales bacterium]
MTKLTPRGEQIIADISSRYQISRESTVSMLISVNNGGGTMAQFSIPEYGSGQWMRGGMTMVGDLFNNQLKANVNNLCEELSNALAQNQIFEPLPAGTRGSNTWWPSNLGVPSSTGGQNNTRYAVFPNERRLAVETNGQVSVYDTLNHNIGGVSQQQGSNNSLTFSSQLGTFSTLNLPLVSGPGGSNPPQQAAPVSNSPNNTSENTDVYENLRKLGELRDAGILSENEFQAKKTELLNRL